MSIKDRIKKRPFLFGLSKSLKDRALWLYDKVTFHKPEKQKFYNELGYELNLSDPRSFNEKIVWKKIYDRNPLLTTTADKYLVREYIKEKLGKEKAEEISVPHLYVTDRPETITFDELPDNFIIKTNHSSGWNILVKNGDFKKDDLVLECQRWLRSPYGLSKNEWAYQKIKRRVIIEKLLQDEEGKVPKDHRFYIFHGKCEIVLLDFDYLDKDKRSVSVFDREWNLMPIEYNKRPKGSKVDKPKRYDEMLALAEKLGEDFDFVRVDLYALQDKIYFAELTHYPVSGNAPWKPREFDFELGEKWQIEPKYWLKDK